MNICVFCGSAAGNNPLYASLATEFGKLLAEGGHSLVYGGGNIGLMGVIADIVLENHGKVIGVIPSFLAQREVAHQQLTQLEIVGTMHERKMRMAELANAFVVLPGGWGTLDEMAEILTWKQLGLVNQNLFILNSNNFFDPLLDQMRFMVKEGFLRQENLDSVVIANSPQQLFSMIP
ncbi:TIGR00730 family Rossman fold protein [Chryseotalea sanaruensis]|uniref:Cytokinin riboside 5'-monophosphate phosphoribohydrolase n=1 Tax=Chryseotalea sanaruensis TaxID=2482724 RepID=A0A401U8A7_9BACT|nr:TIGR00730 family Rossman fold protein [Chryseotalea sanaruensis]GCC51120.1 TIGR00730 family Rossman fold protein [Chryseotalea sanaruensis]